MSIAGKIELILNLLGGDLYKDDDGEEFETPALITSEQAIELLNDLSSDSPLSKE